MDPNQTLVLRLSVEDAEVLHDAIGQAWLVWRKEAQEHGADATHARRLIERLDAIDDRITPLIEMSTPDWIKQAAKDFVQQRTGQKPPLRG